MVAMKPYEGLSETGGESNFQKASKPSHEQKAVLTNGFIKKSQKTPKSTLGYDPMSADEKKPEVTPTATPTPKPTATLILAAIICSDSVFCKRNKKY